MSKFNYRRSLDAFAPALTLALLLGIEATVVLDAGRCVVLDGLQGEAKPEIRQVEIVVRVDRPLVDRTPADGDSALRRR